MENQKDTIYNIPECNMEKLEKKLAKVNKTCRKLGVTEWTLKVIGFEMVKRKNRDGKKVDIKMNSVGIIGEVPKYDGFTFVGKIESHESGVLLLAAPGYEVPEEYREGKQVCDHCGTKRSRKNTYVVEDEQGKLTRVGSSCLKDFLGHANPERIGYYYMFLQELASGEYDGIDWDRSPQYYSLVEILGYAANVVRTVGFVSTKNEWKTSTADLVSYLVSPSGSGHEEKEAKREAREKHTPTEVDIENAKASIEWVRNNDEDSSYIQNLKVLVAEDYVTLNKMGFVVSAVYAYMKQMEKLEAFAKKSNNHCGEVGKRQEFILKSVGSIEIHSGYGYGSDAYSYVNKMEDEAGNAFVWFSKKNFSELAEEDAVKVKATVKKFDSYKERNQTVVTRVTII